MAAGHPAVLAAAAVLAATAGLAACGGSSASSARPPASSAPPPTAPTTVAPTTTTTVPAVATGTAVTLRTPDGRPASVTVLRVAAASPLYSFEMPGAGEQFVGAELQVVNTGTAPLTDSMAVDTSVTDAAGHTYAAVVDDVTGCPSFFGGVVNLAPGATGMGCVSFEVPIANPVTAVRLGLGGSAATSFARWTVTP